MLTSTFNNLIISSNGFASGTPPVARLARGEVFGVVGFDGLIIFPPATTVIFQVGGVFFAAVETSTERDMSGPL